ncbi:hypothetical protein BS17DRAFT_815177 [Gyrodon lividus]|nr:hypothetical protein BS17DRAFT_815177 [Gyrodon lividus]
MLAQAPNPLSRDEAPIIDVSMASVSARPSSSASSGSTELGVRVTQLEVAVRERGTEIKALHERFNAMDQRLDAMDGMIKKRFELMEEQINKLLQYFGRFVNVADRFLKELALQNPLNAHGLRFKIAFAETLTRLLHPIGKADRFPVPVVFTRVNFGSVAKVHHLQWEKAIEKIYPRAKEMVTEPRYWHAAYPLAATALRVALHQYFLKNWIPCLDYAIRISKLKDKPYRIPIMNGMVRLMWTYFYRCQGPALTSTAKLDGLLKHFLLAGRTSIFPPEECQEPFICIESASTSWASSPERVGILVQATLLTLYGIEREDPTPKWPSSADFSAMPSWDDYPSSSDVLPPTVLSKPGMQDFFDRLGSPTSTIAQTSCFKAVGHMSVFDQQWSLARSSAADSGSSFEQLHSVVIRRHPEGAFAYPNHLVSQISILQTHDMDLRC